MVALEINRNKSAVVLQILNQFDRQEVSVTASEKIDKMCNFKDDQYMLCLKKPSPLCH